MSPRNDQGATKAPRLGLQATIIKRINTYKSRRHMKKITEKIYIIGKEGSLQRNDNDRKDVSKILHSDVSKILNSNL